MSWRRSPVARVPDAGFGWRGEETEDEAFDDLERAKAALHED